MSDKSGIEWTDATWNPVRGCSRVSEGCRNCYAEKVAARFCGPGMPYEGLVTLGEKGARWNGATKLVREHLSDPLRWTRPRLVFVNSMSDLFHESLRFEDIAAIFGVMAAASRHTFQVLTKRPARAREFFAWARAKGDGYDLCRIEPSELLACAWEACVGDAWGDAEPPESLDTMPTTDVFGTTWPLPNVWLGVSVEDQKTADERIPTLLELPAALRFVSYEPALGPVDFNVSRDGSGDDVTELDDALGPPLGGDDGIDWIIVGGESGPSARPFDIAWARSTIEQCRAAGVACFWKQAGSHPVDGGKRIWLADRKGGDLVELESLVPDMGPLRRFPDAVR